jgi:hypothetical protein
MTLGTIVAALLTISIFSFLYKENPFYRFAEHLLVGVSMGYGVPLVYENVFIPYVWNQIVLYQRWVIILPACLGILYVFRFSRNYSWLSRYPIVFGMAATGMSVPLSMNSQVLVQMRSAMIPIDGINTFLVFLGTVSILMYFYFSKAHTGVYGKISKVGIWYMMIGFGASFGYTVMARISLLIGRIQFLMRDVLHLIQ